MVTGTLIFNEKIALSPTAVAVITLGDRSPNGAGTIIGQQRIDGVTGTQIPFAVQFDPAVINQKHAYSVYASLIDAGKEWQSPEPVPTITGGPLDGLDVELAAPFFTTPAKITGTISLPKDTVVTPLSVAYATIFNATTGRLAARQVIPTPTTFPIPFVVAFDASLIDPAASYVASAGVIDGATLWQAPAPTPIAPGATLDLIVAKTSTVIPGGATPVPTA